MIQFSHVINDPQGLHARPIASIAAALASVGSSVELELNGRTADARDLLGMLGLEARGGDELLVTVEGADEQQAAELLKTTLP